VGGGRTEVVLFAGGIRGATALGVPLLAVLQFGGVGGLVAASRRGSGTETADRGRCVGEFVDVGWAGGHVGWKGRRRGGGGSLRHRGRAEVVSIGKDE
jgi:hypothetical protein